MSTSMIYVDLAQNPNSLWDFNKTYTWTQGGPNSYNSEGSQGWRSGYYRFPDPTNSFFTTQVPLSSDGNTPLLPSAGLQAIGIPLYWGYGSNSSGLVYAIHTPNPDLHYLQIIAQNPTSTQQLVFAPRGVSSTTLTYIRLDTDIVNDGWFDLPNANHIWDSNFSSYLTGELKARVIPDPVNSANYTIQVKHLVLTVLIGLARLSLIRLIVQLFTLIIWDQRQAF